MRQGLSYLNDQNEVLTPLSSSLSNALKGFQCVDYLPLRPTRREGWWIRPVPSQKVRVPRDVYFGTTRGSPWMQDLVGLKGSYSLRTGGAFRDRFHFSVPCGYSY